MGIGEKLQSIPKWAIYLVLIVCTSVPLFLKIPVPNKPSDASIDYYAMLMSLPTDRPILVETDWTGSTRGESKGAFKATMRILMRRGIKFGLLSTADPQAIPVALDVMSELNAERRAKGQPEYRRWDDWVNLGFFPNSEAALNGMATDLKSVFTGRRDTPPGQPPQDVFQSPVMKGTRRIEDFPVLIVITASKTSNFAVERISGRTNILFAVTGVMVPETQVFYQARQISGFLGGLKGVYDIEMMMEWGVNNGGPNNIKSASHGPIPGFPGEINKGQGTTYFLTLHFALALMILVVILGNIGMWLSRREGKR